MRARLRRGVRAAVRAARGGAGTSSSPARNGYRVYGVVRAGRWPGPPRTLDASREPNEPVVRIRYRDLEALAAPSPTESVPLNREGALGHHRMVEAIQERCTVLPVPLGVVFRGRRAVVRFLESEYQALDEGLSLLDGRTELRLHVAPRAGTTASSPELHEIAADVYTTLRRGARAALPLVSDPGVILTAAFLVDRAGWLTFREQAEQLEEAHPEVELRVTGPWPAYDFVRLAD